MTALWIAIAGGAGSVCRYWIGLGAARAFGTKLPWGTLAVNVIGSLAIGLAFAVLAARGQLESRLQVAITTGFLGGFTTYSAFAYEGLALLERRATALFAIYLVATVALALCACLAGVWLGRALTT